ncbi:MAG: hypothetical protein H0W96_04535 [Solirubrobacterales bacterium]|nr:hypothetical protein [Solirubrobacterales bacterium]
MTSGLVCAGAGPMNKRSAPSVAVSQAKPTSIWVIIVALVGIYVPLLFPTGHYLSKDWRVVGIVTAGMVTMFGASLALAEGPLNNAPFVVNPIGVTGFCAIDTSTGTPYPVFVVGYGAMFLCAIAGVGSVVARFRSARGIERQQLKWLAFGGGMALGFLAGGGLQEQGKIGQYFMIGALQIVPVEVAVAVLRYRLYDVDLVVNRALVYGAVSGTLVASYFALVVLLQTVLRPFTSGSELSVAGSTLVVVALFQPLRRRVQGVVDRRFYRSRYDAARTLDAFGLRLRDEVDLDSVRADLLGVVHETMRPVHASVWLRKG